MIAHNSPLYKERLKSFEQKLSEAQTVFSRISTIRILAFATAVAGLVFLFRSNYPLGLGLFIGGIISFAILLKKHLSIKQEVIRLEWLIEINKNELSALDHDFSFAHNGAAFNPIAHPNAFDLDLFGDRSLYQRLNRTTTPAGARRLADWILAPDVRMLTEHQELLKELSEKVDWRQLFQAEGLTKSNKNDAQTLLQWIAQPAQFISPLWRFLVWVSPLIMGGLIVTYALELIPSSVLVAYFLFQLAIIGTQLKSINTVHGLVSKRQGELNALGRMLETITQGSFVHESLVRRQKKAEGGNQAINRFGKLIGLLDARLNMVAGVLLNGLLLWDIKQILSLEHWKEQHRENLEEWIDAVAWFEAMSSSANYVFNHKDFCWPTTSEKALLTDQLGHPFLRGDERVSNDFVLESGGQLVLLSGANMSGKSTFLRTVGLNLIMAQMGLVVCAKSFEFKPIPVYSSMRINDSLQENESYFFAELKRLKYIIETIKNGEEVLVLLDEILRGTNSNDKHQGSIGLMEQLKDLNTSGIIASHDIALSSLATKYPGRIVNKCFEVENENGELLFDYRLREGVCQNLNATYLMKKMGVIAPH